MRDEKLTENCISVAKEGLNEVCATVATGDLEFVGNASYPLNCPDCQRSQHSRYTQIKRYTRKVQDHLGSVSSMQRLLTNLREYLKKLTGREILLEPVENDKLLLFLRNH